MSRTYRRRGQTHEYRWVLRDWSDDTPSWAHALLDRHSREGRRAIARFHSDAEITLRSSAPRWYRRAFDHRLRTLNDRQLRRWLDDPGYDPVMQIRHRHDANWSWGCSAFRCCRPNRAGMIRSPEVLALRGNAVPRLGAVHSSRQRRRPLKKMLGLSVLLAVAPLAQAADLEAGKARAATVCAACHGANGVSVSDTIPNLAAQRAGYLEAQLKAFKDGTRKAASTTSPAAIMAAIAAQLSADDIANVAAYFAAQPGATGAKSALLPNVAKSRVSFPEGYKESFVKYHTISFPATKQVRYYYANKVAAAAAKAGKPLPDGSVLFAEVYAAKLGADGKPVAGGDGNFVAEKLVAYTAMARDAGWGNDIPEMLRNENWNYAVFTTDKQQRPGINQAECLGCHKPLDKVSYTFTLKQLADAK